MKNIYFISDAHLGSRAIPNGRQQEQRLVRFLDEIKKDAEAIYMLGDMFDFWYEYKMVVPRGFTRFLGKVSELTDMGIEIHYFTGNHDIWCLDYLEKECGVILHRDPITIELGNKHFYIGHGDGLGDPDPKYRILRSIFHNKICWKLFSCIHPRWAVDFGLRWAKHSRMKRDGIGEPPYMGENKEHLVLYAKKYLKAHPGIHYFLFGHRHIELDLMLSHQSRVLIVGDWISQFTYAVFNGENIFLENYTDEEVPA